MCIRTFQKFVFACSWSARCPLTCCPAGTYPIHKYRGNILNIKRKFASSDIEKFVVLDFFRFRVIAFLVSVFVTFAFTGCGGGGIPSISATATTTAQSLTVGSAMASFSPLTPNGGAAPYLYSYSGTLPTGLSLNTATGAVTGTPTAIYSTATVIFSVQDANGVAANTTSAVNFSVGAASPTISATATTTAQSLTVGTAMASFSPLTPSGGATPYTYSITTGTLPTGLGLNANTGAVTGTPSATYSVANVVFSVKDANNVVASTTSTVSFTVVAPAPAISATATTTAQSLTVGSAMASFSPLTPSGGATPYTYSITSGTLPTGLGLNASTGTVTGTPSATYSTANVVFSVKDANNVVASTTSTVSFTVSWPAGYVSQGGLTWMPASSLLVYAQALTLCSNQGAGWRLPTHPELSSLYTSGAMNLPQWTLGYTVSSTSTVAGEHDVVNLANGGSYSSLDSIQMYVTCVLP